MASKAKASPNSTPKWGDIKQHLSKMDNAGLLTVIQDLYASNKECKAFLHARFDPSAGVDSYKKTIKQWINPDSYSYSVSKAKKPIADFKKASGTIPELADLMVYYCEQACLFADSVGGTNDAAFYSSLFLMFKEVLPLIKSKDISDKQPYLDRLKVVIKTSGNFGYGYPDSLIYLWKEAGFS